MQITTRSFWAVRNGDAIVAAIAGFALIYLFTRHSGIGVSPDSVTYISVASNIHDHRALIDFHGDPLIDFPAFYPLFLSSVQWITGIDCLRSGPALNGLLFAALVYYMRVADGRDFLSGRRSINGFSWPLSYRALACWRSIP